MTSSGATLPASPTVRLGILGGTFDPVHLGHLDAAGAATTALALDAIMLLPSHDPPHKPAEPRASGFHRFAMVSLAIADRPRHVASDLELMRPGPTYTIDTLQTLHSQGWQPSQLFFVMGADAFADIATWRAFPAVTDAANFVVIGRPGATLEGALHRAPSLRSRVRSTADHGSHAAGTSVFLVEARTRDVSSTAIRERLSARESIADLVPAAVAHHILTHHLYGADDDLHGQDQR
jgi:nicotinate-nucleotide adenylyltransferase